MLGLLIAKDPLEPKHDIMILQADPEEAGELRAQLASGLCALVELHMANAGKPSHSTALADFCVHMSAGRGQTFVMSRD